MLFGARTDPTTRVILWLSDSELARIGKFSPQLRTSEANRGWRMEFNCIISAVSIPLMPIAHFVSSINLLFLSILMPIMSVKRASSQQKQETSRRPEAFSVSQAGGAVVPRITSSVCSRTSFSSGGWPAMTCSSSSAPRTPDSKSDCRIVVNRTYSAASMPS